MSKQDIPATISNIKKNIEEYNKLTLNEKEKKREKARIDKNILECMKYLSELEKDLTISPRKKGNRGFDKIKRKMDTLIKTDIEKLDIDEKLDLYIDLNELISWSESYNKGKITEIEVK